MNANRIEAIKAALSKLNPTELMVVDNSHLHVGHAGAKSGKGHFAVSIQASCFEGKTRLQCHRLIYEALGALMDTDIHALEIKIL